MESCTILPFEIRLNIYEKCLAHCFDAPGICAVPWEIPFGNKISNFSRRRWHEMRDLITGFKIRAARFKHSVPPVLQAEFGEARSSLLKWLAKYRGIKPDEGTPTLRFRDRAYIPEHDFLYLPSPDQMHIFFDSDSEHFEGCEFAGRIRRIALPASIRHTMWMPLFLKQLDILPNLRELAFAFVELDHGELEFIDSIPKKNPSAYTLERLGDGDIADYRRKLTRSIEGLEAFIRPMLGNHARQLKITACKMIRRC